MILIRKQMTQKRGPVASDAAADIINQSWRPPGSPGDFGLEEPVYINLFAGCLAHFP